MPLDKLLLETDDQDNLTIEDIYLKAASIKNMDVKILENQIESNFNNFITNNGNAC
jgi:Tat protein secretion system quality control protein TatD with DNase activity